MALILVIDANILFSALIKNSQTANLVFNQNLKLYTSEFIVDEFLKYQQFIQEKMSRSENDYIQIMHLLKDIITVIPQEEYNRFMKGAKDISPDENDIAYIALALELKCGIWSNDKKLKKQVKVKVYSTDEVMKLV